MKKIWMVWIVNNVVTSLNTHNGWYTHVCTNILEEYFWESIDIINEKDDFNDYDVLIINEWVNYKNGVFNIFWWVWDTLRIRLNKLNHFNWKLYSINEKINYIDLINKRKELIGFKFEEKDIEIIDISKVSDKLILWDSHVLSVYKRWYSLNRNDWKTMNWFLKDWLETYITSDIEHLMLYAWNIDIRFHIHRFKGNDTIDIIMKALESQCKSLYDKWIMITLVEVLPIESEDRKIPGTWQYEWENFYWTQKERTWYANYWNLMLKKITERNWWELLRWDHFGEYLDFEYMEQRQSVHLRPLHYMFN